MYIELKEDGITGPGRIGRVSFSKTGRSLYYGGRRFESLSGQGFKSNYFDVQSGDAYWISGCKAKGRDRLYPGAIEIDDEVREEYWTEIRKQPERKLQRTICCPGKYGGKKGKAY